MTGLIIAAILTSAQGLRGYGEFAFLQAIYLIWCTISKPSTWQAIIKYAPNDNLASLAKLSLSTELFSWAAASLILIVTTIISSKFLTPPITAQALAAIIIGSIFANNGTLIGYTRSKGNFSAVAITQLTSSALKVILCTKLSYDPKLFFTISTISDGLAWGAATLVIANKIKNEPNKSRKTPRADFVKFSFWGNALLVLDLPVSQLDKIIVSALIGPEATGALDIMKKTSQAIGQAAAPINQIIFPKFSEYAAKGNTKEIEEISKKITTLLIAASVVAVITIAILFEHINTLIFSGEISNYKTLLITYTAVQGLALSFIWVHPLSIIYARMQSIATALLISNTLYVLIILLMAGKIGITAVVLAFSAQSATLILQKLYLIKRIKDPGNEK